MHEEDGDASAAARSLLELSRSGPSEFADDDDETPQRRRRGSRYLQKTAVKLMERWYASNKVHPYPSDEEIERLSAEGGITRAQVKKWMANKRVRNCNTLSYNGMH